ncbi:hypothetical protein I7I53_02880 [Histoplasma capsulatum var. duboisii H88]|uniref:Uncharacterized protein n=1 Tax=Ajellomyces capsulatus (strain H88) TaxID=544711 RepID=A0A8A1LSY4_AJEC8|nr:hypothetical protein I7I53_02880 [Histoplasma capsulatum var. duboisii H88]
MINQICICHKFLVEVFPGLFPSIQKHLTFHYPPRKFDQWLILNAIYRRNWRTKRRHHRQNTSSSDRAFNDQKKVKFEQEKCYFLMMLSPV